MEEDRAQTDLGIAADIEESQLAQASDSEQPAQSQQPVTRQPKKRFVGRRAATEAAAKNGVAEGESGAVQGMSLRSSCEYRAHTSKPPRLAARHAS